MIQNANLITKENAQNALVDTLSTSVTDALLIFLTVCKSELKITVRNAKMDIILSKELAKHLIPTASNLTKMDVFLALKIVTLKVENVSKMTKLVRDIVGKAEPSHVLNVLMGMSSQQMAKNV